jgi:hypothetical protein
MNYKTIRALERIKRSNHKKLMDILGRETCLDYLNEYKGKNIIILEDPKFSKTNEIIGGIFRGGVLEDFQTYERTDRAIFSVNLWFEKGNFATGLENIYEIMFPNTTIKRKEKLKIFNFFAGAAEEIEESSVIDSDPFLAYMHLRRSGKMICPKQELLSTEPLEAGKIFYEHKTFA